jgi:DNA polymerase I
LTCQDTGNDSFHFVDARRARSAIRKYGSLEKALGAGRFAREADKLRLYLSIATMDKKAPLPPLRNQKPKWEKAASLAHEWQLNKLADRLQSLATVPRT